MNWFCELTEMELSRDCVGGLPLSFGSGLSQHRFTWLCYILRRTGEDKHTENSRVSRNESLVGPLASPGGDPALREIGG
jgi:hypothetical protein